MGFFSRKNDNRADRARDAIEQLRERAADHAAGGHLGMSLNFGDMRSIMDLANEARAERGPMVAYAQKLQHLAMSGTPAQATVRAVSDADIAALMGGEQLRVELTVEPDGGAPFDAVAEQVFVQGQRDSLVPGTRVPVRYDPADPQSVMVMLAAPAGAMGSGQTVVMGGGTGFISVTGSTQNIVISRDGSGNTVIEPGGGTVFPQPGQASGPVFQQPGQVSGPIFGAPSGALPTPEPTAGPADAAPAADDRIGQLQQLAQMHTDGVLTDEEFAAAKHKLLG